VLVQKKKEVKRKKSFTVEEEYQVVGFGEESTGDSWYSESSFGDNTEFGERDYESEFI
jgi:hypothetical protein